MVYHSDAFNMTQLPRSPLVTTAKLDPDRGGKAPYAEKGQSKAGVIEIFISWGGRDIINVKLQRD